MGRLSLGHVHKYVLVNSLHAEIPKFSHTSPWLLQHHLIHSTHDAKDNLSPWLPYTAGTRSAPHSRIVQVSVACTAVVCMYVVHMYVVYQLVVYTSHRKSKRYLT